MYFLLSTSLFTTVVKTLALSAHTKGFSPLAAVLVDAGEGLLLLSSYGLQHLHHCY